VFAGPSLARRDVPPGIEVLPPATRGALAGAVRAGFTRIAFVDGALDAASQVPLRELRQILAYPEIQVFGAASMGAIRAVQLAAFGMCGIGRVFRLLRRGSLTDSDEVFVLHAPAALRYRCLTLPLVNIRYTLRLLRRRGHLSSAEEHAIAGYIQDVPWFDRDKRSMSAAVYSVCGSTRSGRVMQAFEASYRDIKREDALTVLSMLRPGSGTKHRSVAIARMGIR
jgi:hypothetical protein